MEQNKQDNLLFPGPDENGESKDLVFPKKGDTKTSEEDTKTSEEDRRKRKWIKHVEMWNDTTTIDTTTIDTTTEVHTTTIDLYRITLY